MVVYNIVFIQLFFIQGVLVLKDNYLEKTKVKKIGASVHHTHSITNLFGSYVVFVNLWEKHLKKSSFGALKLVTLILALQFLLKHTHITVTSILK